MLLWFLHVINSTDKCITTGRNCTLIYNYCSSCKWRVKNSKEKSKKQTSSYVTASGELAGAQESHTIKLRKLERACSWGTSAAPSVDYNENNNQSLTPTSPKEAGGDINWFIRGLWANNDQCWLAGKTWTDTKWTHLWKLWVWWADIKIRKRRALQTCRSPD